MRLYDPAWGDHQWNPGFKCCWTMELDESRYHCPEPKCGGPSSGPIKTECYRKLHVAICCVVVKTKTGHSRFCGHRFQVEYPKACALHHWGPNNENKFYQLAKKQLPFQLPPMFPHEQPGWEMDLRGTAAFAHRFLCAWVWLMARRASCESSLMTRTAWLTRS